MESSKPNVLIVLTDQQRADSLGCAGNPCALTPNIDALAADGMFFPRHFASSPVCMPSRASFHTGMSVPGHGVSTNGVPLWRNNGGLDSHHQSMLRAVYGCGIHEQVPTLADILGEHGYSTASFGKLHFQPHLAPKGYPECHNAWEDETMESWKGPYYGFNEVKLILSHGEQCCERNSGHYGRWLWEKHPEEAQRVREGSHRAQQSDTRGDIYLSSLPSSLHHTAWLAEEACRYLDTWRDSGRPFFLFVGFPDPHHPYIAPQDAIGRVGDLPWPDAMELTEDMAKKKPEAVRWQLKWQQNQEDIQAAIQNTAISVSLIDDAVGRIVRQLKGCGQYRNTIVLFTSDHGDYLGNYGLLGKDTAAFRCLLQVPLILKTAGKATNAVASEPTSNADIAPTLMSMLGFDIPPHMQGRNMLSSGCNNNMPVSHGYGIRPEWNNISIFDPRYRYTLYPVTGEEELYDHSSDPLEIDNLAFGASGPVRQICNEFRQQLCLLHAERDTRMYGVQAPW